MRRMGERHNVASLLAQLLGFLSAVVMLHLLTLLLVRWLHSGAVLIWTAYGINSLLTLIGCLYLLGMPRVGSQVFTLQGFWRDFRFAFVTTLFMPFFLALSVFVLWMGRYKE